MIEFTEEDDELSVWIEEYGCVTSYSFMIYSPMTIKDNCIVNKGLTMIMMHNNLKDTRYIQIIDEFDNNCDEKLLYSIFNLIDQDNKYLLINSLEPINELKFKLPMVIRFQGTNATEGRDIINKSTLELISISDFTEAAKKVVELAK